MLGLNRRRAASSRVTDLHRVVVKAPLSTSAYKDGQCNEVVRSGSLCGETLAEMCDVSVIQLVSVIKLLVPCIYGV
jgi:hypothetical protein